MALRAPRQLYSRFPRHLRPASAQPSYFSTSSRCRIAALDSSGTPIKDIPLDNASSLESTLSSASSQTEQTSTSTIPAASKMKASPPRLQYHVSRTPSNNLPVYTETRNGKTRKETIIRKVAGDPRPLRDAIRDLLGVEADRVWVGKVTGHVYVKGHHKPAIDAFLAQQGF